MIPSYLLIEGKTLPLLVRENRKAKRYTIRLRPEMAGEIVLTLPRIYSKRQVLKFIEQSKPWIAKQLVNSTPKIQYESGMTLPIFGKDYELKHKLSETFHSWWEDDHLLIHSPTDKFADYVQKSLQIVAMQFFQKRTHFYASQLSKTVNRVTLRDTRSRWGSCTVNGNISYSWRLIFAPMQVADYVCAHEVAHLIELNHSNKFWQIVEEFCPDYKQLRHWLRQNGKNLFLYGT